MKHQSLSMKNTHYAKYTMPLFRHKQPYQIGFPLFWKKKKFRSFPVQFYNFSGACGHSLQLKYLKYETFVIEVHHSFPCSTN